MDDKQFENSTPWTTVQTHETRSYGGDPSMEPEETITHIQPTTHRHYFIRRDAKTVSCRDCTLNWVASLEEMNVSQGKITHLQGQEVGDPVYN